MKVLIPAKSSSVRVYNKNWRLFFNNNSLVDIKIQQLLKFFSHEDIYLSCEDYSKKELVHKYKINFILRDQSLCLPTTQWSDFLLGVTEQLNFNEAEEVLIAQVTSPLFCEFDQVINIWNEAKEQQFDSLITTKLMRSYLLNEDNIPVNYLYGRWHTPSENLPKWKTMELAAHILNIATLKKLSYHVGLKPYSFNIEGHSIDIDTEDDFNLAQVLYKIKFIDGPHHHTL